MNPDARALAIALDRTVRREIRYRQTLARAASAGTKTGLEQPEAANDATMNDALLSRAATADAVDRALGNDPESKDVYRRTVRVNVIVLVTVATLLALVALIA
jgi:hypothetical protein